LDRFVPDWRDKVIHESSPAQRLVSERMRDEAATYFGSQYFPEVQLGSMHNGFRCENLEGMTFADSSIDVHVHLDVLEHVNHPEHCFAEMERTLRPGGMMVFTTPVYDGKQVTERRSFYDDAGKIQFLFEPEYHGNPIDNTGSPVTFHYGSDLAELIMLWTKNCGVLQLTPNDPRLGVVGKFREVFVVTKYEEAAKPLGKVMSKIQSLKSRLSARLNGN
jgi:SAM-dependent methyltransferase